jgi:L-aspartate oxidase
MSASTEPQLSFVPRYLVPFHPKRVPHHFADVLIIGGGVAGFRAALAVDPRLSVVLVTKESVEQSNSNYAQGGIAGVMDPEDRFENHIEDTLKAGGSLCDREVVEMVVREAPARIRELIEWGADFDRQAESGARFQRAEPTGQGNPHAPREAIISRSEMTTLTGHVENVPHAPLALGREGGHSHHRIVHALGDATGREMMRAIISRAKQLANLQIWNDTFLIDLLTHEAACRGALAWNPRHGKTLVWAKQTILCAGGTGQVYRETTNPGVATGDGLAMAYRAGAELRDMEFMQFHPTVLYIAGSSRTLITEAVRGEGAHLVDRHGHRFMPDYDPRLELAPRDVVSQAIVSQMEKTRSPCVFLDMSHLDADFVRRRFPGIAAVCGQFNLDIARDRIPVRPGAHYMIGGVTVDFVGRTTVPGLWAAGEVTSSGLHGANRLASNSLLEGLVYGAHAGEEASRAALEQRDDFLLVPLENLPQTEPAEPLDLADIRNSLQSLMWRNAGIRRDGERLTEARDTIGAWCQYALARQLRDAAGWALQNMLIVAELMVTAALERQESRGVHLRTDFANLNEVDWRRHITFRRAERLS